MKEKMSAHTSPEYIKEGREMTAEETHAKIYEWKDHIPGKDRFQRVKEKGKDVLITSEGERFLISKLNNESQKSFKKLGKEIKEFNDEFFDPEENDAPAEFQAALEDNISNFYAIRNAEGELVSLLNTQIFNLEGQEEHSKDEIMLLVWYVATKEEYRNKGLSTEMYRQAYEDLIRAASAQNVAIHGIFGETEDDVEGYLNKTFGRRRAYFETQTGVIKEVPYVCPPSAYGEGQFVSTHFMGRLSNEHNEMKGSEYLAIIKSIFTEYTRPEYFEQDSPGTHERYVAVVDAKYEEISKEIGNAKEGKIFFMTKEERKQLETQGRIIQENTEEE